MIDDRDVAEIRDNLRRAVKLAQENVAHGGRPFGAIIMRDGQIIAEGTNTLLETGDPTDHAELRAVRAAAQALASPRLDGCVVYASGQPCPMCLAAMYMAGIRDIFYTYSNADGEPFGLSTARIYDALVKPVSGLPLNFEHVPLGEEGGPHIYRLWAARSEREG